MTAAEIRSTIRPDHDDLDRIQLHFIGRMTQEIAAQLAEFNERCAQNCTPPKKDYFQKNDENVSSHT